MFFYSLQFEPDGNILAAGRLSASTSDILIYDSNTLEEQILVEGHVSSVESAISFQWLEQGLLNYCIDPALYGPEGDPKSESVIHTLRTDETSHIPVCVGDVSPDGQYGLRKTIEAEIEVVDLTTTDVVDTLALTDLIDTDPFTLFEVTYYKWEISGVIVWRGTPLTIWRPELPK